jgi:hypothetical protein
MTDQGRIPLTSEPLGKTSELARGRAGYDEQPDAFNLNLQELVAMLAESDERKRKAAIAFAEATTFTEAVASVIEWRGCAFVVGSPEAFAMPRVPLDLVPVFHELMDRGELVLMETNYLDGTAVRVLPPSQWQTWRFGIDRALTANLIDTKTLHMHMRRGMFP